MYVTITHGFQPAKESLFLIIVLVLVVAIVVSYVARPHLGSLTAAHISVPSVLGRSVRH